MGTYRAKREKPKTRTDLTRSFLVALNKTWSKWRDALIIVKPETVIDWQKRRFKKFWTKKSVKNKKPGRPSITPEIREVIKKMATENFSWGAPRIFSEILKLGYTEKDVSQRTVSRYIKKIRSNDAGTDKKWQQWKTFLKNHREYILAMDFFTVPTVSFKILYVFFIIYHARRQVVHFNVTEHPTSQRVKQQLREAIPCDTKKRYLIFDRDSIFSAAVKAFIKNIINIKPKVTSYRSPWQNGVAERYILSARDELLHHVVIFTEEQLWHQMKEYIEYYNSDRCHLSVGRDSPNGREAQMKPSESAKVVSLPRLGGLHHKYEWRDAA